jgi:hypothetical protein
MATNACPLSLAKLWGSDETTTKAAPLSPADQHGSHRMTKKVVPPSLGEQLQFDMIKGEIEEVIVDPSPVDATPITWKCKIPCKHKG